MARRLVAAGLAAGLAMLAGCASAPARFYTLTSTATATGGPSVHDAVLVGPVTVPASIDRPELVVQVAPNRVTLQEFDRWAGPLGEGIARAIAGDLATLLGTTRVASGPLANFDPTYRVTIDVQRFDSIPAESVLVEAVWVVHAVSDRETRAGQTVAREAVEREDRDGYEALAAAHSRALAQVSGAIAAAIRDLSRRPR